MNRAFVLAVPALVGAWTAAPALASDPRLVQHLYNDNEVVRIAGHAGVQATIQFGPNEAIENVAVGDSASWQITPNKRADLLFVKPMEAAARTNMTVVTNRHTYFFDLVASPKGQPLYLLRFAYRDADKPSVLGAPVPGEQAPKVAALSSQEQAITGGDLAAMPTDPAALNYAWKRVGTAKLWPSRVWDDGSSTYLLWPDKSAVPAILMRNEKGDEGPVNYAVRDATIVIPEVPRALVLRSGKDMAELQNTAPEPPRHHLLRLPLRLPFPRLPRTDRDGFQPFLP
ncbi:TrbG/VirB9 family P-type conjugative transfer protein [Novosphingobium sp. 9]|uniref:TrbG/VirB9 family P-type conjugative transfer protein n=1 Tax=Novosphingobium sp. 9 TaxID=2025349 RepID=UPI0021B4E819|nr:TrbG/VirB9 family P-type conjugative transfer protein [Novosphingobium sp. 9]